MKIVGFAATRMIGAPLTTGRAQRQPERITVVR